MTPSERVLVVDGDRYFRETIRDALTEEGIACEVVGSGPEAQKAVEDPRIACVVLDVRVETPDAIGVLEALLAERPALRVIAVSGHGDQELVLEALRRGACDYLAKPLHDEEMCLAVNRALAGHAALSRWQATRERIARLADIGDELGEAAADADRDALTARAASALVDVLGVSRVDAERVFQKGAAAVESLDGADRDEALGLLRLFAASVRSRLEPATRPVPAPVTSGDADTNTEILREIAEAATREIEPERLLAASLRPIARETGARTASIFLIDNVSGRLARQACIDGTDVERSDLPRDRGLTGACLQSGALIATDHPERDPRFDPAVDTPEGGASGPVLIVPLRMRDRVLGVARIFPADGDGASARFGENLVAPLSAATRNVLLYRSLLESVEDVAKARRDAEANRRS